MDSEAHREECYEDAPEIGPQVVIIRQGAAKQQGEVSYLVEVVGFILERVDRGAIPAENMSKKKPASTSEV